MIVTMKEETSADISLVASKSLNELLVDTIKYFKYELKGNMVVPEMDNQLDMVLAIFSLIESSHLALLAPEESMCEGLLNNILTCVVSFEAPEETREKWVHNLANKLADLSSSEYGMKYLGARQRVLSTLFYGLEETSASRFTPYCRLLELAAVSSHFYRVPTEPSQVKEWISFWKLDVSQVHVLWRTLYGALVETGQITKASRVKVELRKTFVSDVVGATKTEAFDEVNPWNSPPRAPTPPRLGHSLPVLEDMHGMYAAPYKVLDMFAEEDDAEERSPAALRTPVRPKTRHRMAGLTAGLASMIPPLGMMYRL